jgi:NAD(P)H-hydrate repair Nnr-like enzyme with NAD(P)H-hydrate dehydratase domain
LSGAPVGDDRLAAARALAARSGASVLLKGRATVVADPDGTVWLSATGGPALATAGTGDVLSGIAGAFLARGVTSPRAAGAFAAFVHGLAAVQWRAPGGSGLVAGDLPDLLPAVLS